MPHNFILSALRLKAFLHKKKKCNLCRIEDMFNRFNRTNIVEYLEENIWSIKKKDRKMPFLREKNASATGGVATSRQSSDVVVATNIRRFKHRHLLSRFVSHVFPALGWDRL